jgi:hypothetical protein
MASLALNLLIVTALMHPDSPIALSTSVFDDTSFMRSRLTWANFIAIMIVTPVSFALNKIWTFRSVRGIQGGRGGRG